VNCIVGGTGVSLGLLQAGLAKAASILIGVLVRVFLLVWLAVYQVRQFTWVKAATAAAAA
jgi:hypothetical protein